jgi:hypothetical protein
MSYRKNGVPFSRCVYILGMGVLARRAKVGGDGLGAIHGSFFFNLQQFVICIVIMMDLKYIINSHDVYDCVMVQ